MADVKEIIWIVCDDLHKQKLYSEIDTCTNIALSGGDSCALFDSLCWVEPITWGVIHLIGF